MNFSGGVGGGGGSKTSFGQWFEKQQQEATKEEAAAGAGGVSAWARQWGEDAQSLLPTFRRQESQPQTGFGGVAKDSVIMGISYAQRFKGFVGGLLLSVLFFLMAFFVGLPTVVFRPHKFALCFTLGSACFMCSFAMLKGPVQHCRAMCSLERAPFSVAYVGSMVGTLYACLVLRSYALVIVFSAVQLLSLFWFFASMLPGGNAGMKIFVGAMLRTARVILMPCTLAIRQCCRV